MKTLLIRPPATFYPGAVRPLISLPVGLLSIAAVLEQESFPVNIYDAQLNLANPVSDVDGAIVLGDKWGDVESRIKASGAGIIGVSCGFSSQLPNALKVAAIARNCCPGAMIIVGGPHASVKPGDLLQSGSPVNLICIGEGEYTLLEVVQAISAGRNAFEIAGTVSRCREGIQANPARAAIAELDTLPFPAYHLVDMEQYFQFYESGFADRPTTLLEGSNRSVPVITSRGCPFNCIFCSIHLHMGRRWRGNSAEYVNRHVDLLVRSYRVKHVHFEDDNISFNRQRFEDIVTGLMPLHITWDTPNGVRVDTLTEQIVQKCRKSGCTYLVFGVESGNQQVLDSIVDKRLDLGAVLEAARWCKDAELDSMAFYVVGFPGETPSDMRETVDFALKLYADFDVKPDLFLATPLPGTRLEKILLEKKLIDAPLSSEQLAAMTQGRYRIDGGTFCTADIDRLMQLFVSGYRKIFVVNAMKFLIMRPRAVIGMMLLLFRPHGSPTLLKRLFSALQLKNASLESRK